MSACEMKGFLSFIVLRMISKQEMSGDAIRDELEKRKGCRPSAGTVYPVLKELKEKGLIKEVKDGGKEKKYHITESGQKEVKAAIKKFIALFSDLKDEFSRCC
ncbi:MAG TPA: PadR family transcriptional regulator [Candidatus Binatia bacterium]|nr:PadR family transcriptional regulator [Candidatus Binatia bacterium]